MVGSFRKGGAEMNIKEAGNWLIVRLEDQERNPDLNWNRLVTWKIPESDRIYVKGGDFWIVRRRHRLLIRRLFSIYQAMGQTDLDMEALKRCDLTIKDIDREAEPGRQDFKLRQVRVLEAWKRAGKGNRWPGMYEMERN